MSSSLSGPSNFADDGSAVISRQVEVHHSRLASEPQNKIKACSDIYEIDRTVAVIKERGYKRIALQFPDELLPDSGLVAQLIREHTGSGVYILADTSYGSCCVDEVAAQHIAADAIIHYGRSCQSPTSRLPVIYVFGKQPVDVQHCASVLDGFFAENKSRKIVLMYDVIYAHCIDQLMGILETELKYTNIVKSRVETESNLGYVLSNPDSAQASASKCDQLSSCCQSGENNAASACSNSSGCQTAISTMMTHRQQQPATNNADEGDHAAESNISKRRKFGRTYDLPKGDNIEDYTLFYVGDESTTLSNIMMTHSKCDVYSYSPEKREGRLESAQVNRALMRRYFLVQKAKDADVIGIAVGTLGVASYMTMIQHLKALIESKGKKAYTFVMGKLNVAKMANFMEIDCFVYVACPENSLIDSKEFYRPIVTPYELEIALSKSREWTGEYVTDFQQLLPEDDKIGVDKVKISQAQLDAASDREDERESSDQDSDEDEAPHFSLVTGQYKQNKKYTTNKKDSKELSALVEGTKDLTVRDKNTSVATLMSSAAGEYLQSRQFRGLEVQLGETPVELATEGRAGIARGYNSENGYNSREKEKY
ncbi:putative diphthamide synthesis protein-domain-containing protein [Gamsiella multidivaricata]|uniref:putative diphthamide synthesis protein-domain-containing protein n=1 Tax=Gamsiella multidivaricata TaxID=101098 RepID=UPI00221F6E62|nr:putative diphthamide synthesis protein-domain-containing protein [Gamsiella multidivaricata]KAG0364287.1 Diphthamide biosynthesis protein 2 [Gamsiella multidivaricata]KAI7828644.1 putative diphthamide synthesis protein-domain-containing protein [Gamsiella multidivaricata]